MGGGGGGGRLCRANTLSHTTPKQTNQQNQKRAAIERLRGQNAALKQELLLENKFSVRPSSRGAAALLTRLQDEADAYARKVQVERRKLSLLEQRLGGAGATLVASRAGMGGVYAARELEEAAAKATKSLEDRLEKAAVRYRILRGG